MKTIKILELVKEMKVNLIAGRQEEVYNDLTNLEDELIAQIKKD